MTTRPVDVKPIKEVLDSVLTPPPKPIPIPIFREDLVQFTSYQNRPVDVKPVKEVLDSV